MDLDESATSTAAAAATTEGSGGPSTSTSAGKRSNGLNLTLQDDDPFELDAYIAPYSDRRRIERLLFVARNCASLRQQAYSAALETIKSSSLDYKLYADVVAECKEVAAVSLSPDQTWISSTKAKQESGWDKLEVELKNYQNNLIKESIRVSW